jgi:hypothetical protein
VLERASAIVMAKLASAAEQKTGGQTKFESLRTMREKQKAVTVEKEVLP